MLGAIGKLVATIVTYPLILGKIRIQASQKSDNGQSEALLDILRKAVEDEGFTGLYKGMKAKIIQTCLKSALDFAMKEKITNVAFRLLHRILVITGTTNVETVKA